MSIDRSPIAIVRDHIESWRRANDWSRETAVQQIVEAHERLGLDRLTGIAFDPPTKDAYGRMKINAERVYRWLDDHSKDKNLLPVNFLWSILAGLPMDRRMALADALLEPVDIGAVENGAAIEAEPDSATVIHFHAVATSATEAQVALADMVKDGIQPGEAEAARTRLKRAGAAMGRALVFVGSLMRRRKAKP